MPRAHWIILAIGVALMLFFSLSPEQRRPVTEGLLRDDTASVDESGLGEPDLLLESATITQFQPDGRLHYRLDAERISHYPEVDQIHLQAPRLMLERGQARPWELSAQQGTITGGSQLLEPADSGRPPAETVTLEHAVVLRREGGRSGPLVLETEQLQLYPDLEYAETDQPVMIASANSRTEATGLLADFSRGRLTLAATPDTRVHTTLTADSLP